MESPLKTQTHPGPRAPSRHLDALRGETALPGVSSVTGQQLAVISWDTVCSAHGIGDLGGGGLQNQNTAGRGRGGGGRLGIWPALPPSVSPGPSLCPRAHGHRAFQHPPAGPQQWQAPETALGPRECGAHSSSKPFTGRAAPRTRGIREHRQGPQVGKGGLAMHQSEEESQGLPQGNSGVSECPSPVTLCPHL